LYTRSSYIVPVRTDDFDYFLPPELIAQEPAERRDQSRLMVLARRDGKIAHRHFFELPEFLEPGDVLVVNDSRVIPARLRGTNQRSGGQFEVLLLEEVATNDWWTMLRPGKRARVGTRIVFRAGGEHEKGEGRGEKGAIEGEVLEVNDEGHRRLRFSGTDNILDALHELGEVPLPPYIKRDAPARGAADRERYQTVYAQTRGSVAAPTAGLHFTPELLEKIRSRGVEIVSVTLHVGLGTFAPVKADELSKHRMHEERYLMPPETAARINAAKAAGKRVVGVGTTSVRVMESVARANKGKAVAGSGRTDIFIYPPAKFQLTDAMVTNFHLPCSTLLMLVSAFAGRVAVLAAYAEAVREKYRFFSYGDAMLIL
jgi:S-adenosylmethionine:tRNA ribosyltransferase-isomerase